MSSLQCSIARAQAPGILNMRRSEDDRRCERKADAFFVGGRVGEWDKKIAIDRRLGRNHCPTRGRVPLVTMNTDERAKPKPVAADYVCTFGAVRRNIRRIVVDPLLHWQVSPSDSLYHPKNVNRINRVKSTLPIFSPAAQWLS